MKLWKSFASIILAAALALSCTGCMTKLPEEPEENPPGRYVESNLGRPGDGFPLAVGIVDGQLRVLGSTGLYESRYSGAAWGRMLDSSPTLSDAWQSWSIMSGCFTPEGGVIVCVAQWGETNAEGNAFAEGYSYVEVDSEGSDRVIDITLPDEDDVSGPSEIAALPVASNMAVAPDGNILIRSTGGSLHRFHRETGELLHTYSCGSSLGFSAFAVVGDTLVTITSEGSALYSYETGELLDNDMVLNQFITGLDEDGDPIKRQDEYGAKTLGGGGVLFTCPEEEDYLYILGHNGIYRHMLGGSVIQQLVNGELCSLMNPVFSAAQAIKTGDNEFYVACQTVGGSEGPGLLQYVYDPDIPYFPEIVLTVYSLHEDYDLQQAIAEYRQEHEDVYLIYEVGTNFGAGMTVDDAIRNLNADIMNGEGPDILLLNDVPMDSYIDKGVLMDLTDMKEELLEEEDLFENILTAYERDGGICALPTHFGVPLMYAPGDVLENAGSLSELADEIVRLRFENPAAEQDCIIGSIFPGVLIDQLYPVCAPAWEREDGSIDRELLTEFLRQAKRAWDAEDRGRDHEKQSFVVNVSGSTFGAGVLDGSCLLALANLDDGQGLAMMATMSEDFPDYSYKLLPGQAENVFLPIRSVGILSDTGHPDVARDFVKGLFSQSSQRKSMNSGLMVNREAFRATMKEYGNYGFGPMTTYTDEGEPVEVIPFIRFHSVPAGEIKRMEGIIDGLDTPLLCPEELMRAVSVHGGEYLEGSATLEEAVDSIMSQVSLYLAEKQ